MINDAKVRNLFPSQLAVFVLASAIAIPAFAQQTNSQSASPQPSAIETQVSSNPASQPPAAAKPSGDQREGFWGRVNPFARKKWVNKRIDPIKDRLTELDEVNAKNARDIKDVDARAQAGIHNAQTTADAANQAASAAGDEAQKANGTAQQASTHVNQLNGTISGIDQYRPVTEVDVVFHGAQPVLNAEAKKQLDDLATSLTDRKGYIVEIEGHSPGAGSLGIQSSGRLTEAVKRYLVVEHQIPVYRLHAVALGNAPAAQASTGEESNNKPARVSRVVHIRLMENSLAAQGNAQPHSDASLSGAERP